MVAETSLYDRLGGEIAIMAAVDLFYDKVLADPLTRPFFEGIDMAAQARKQVAFMTYAFGGPVAQRGRDLRAAHAHLVRDQGLGDHHFDAVATHLSSTLDELGIDPSLKNEVLSIVGGTRSEVLDR
jgi:hemoglobin